MGVPILRNHCPGESGGDLGSLSPVAGRLFFQFDAPITRDMFFEIFPGAGAKFTEAEIVDGALMVKAGEILEFSLIDKAEGPG